MNDDNLKQQSRTHLNQGRAYLRVQDYTQAVAAFSRAIELDPASAHAYYNRGLARAQLGDYAQAIQDYERTIQLKPRYAMAYHERGVARFQLQDYGRAIDDFQRAIELWPHFARSYYHMARVCARLGQTQDACEWLAKSVARADVFRQTAREEADFEGMREDPSFRDIVEPSLCFEIVPGTSIGPFKLGMTHDQIERLRVDPMERLEHQKGFRFPLLGVTVFFDASGSCNKIEAQVFNRSTPTFLLAGHVVNDVSANKTVEIFNSISAGITFGYARYDLPAAGLRAIKWEADDPFIHVIQVIPI